MMIQGLIRLGRNPEEGNPIGDSRNTRRSESNVIEFDEEIRLFRKKNVGSDVKRSVRDS
jgi:hypothetical protein